MHRRTQIALTRLARGHMARGRAARRDQFATLGVPPRRVVLLGDSITEQGVWDEWFPQHAVLNRGISSDTIDGVAGRLDSAINEPSLVSLLIGTNDLGGGGSSTDVARIVPALDALLGSIVRRAPETTVLVNSVMPRTADFAAVIRQTNLGFAAAARRHGAAWLDLWPVMADASGALRGELTWDGLHLNGQGYAVWVEALAPYLAEHGRRGSR